ncbi:MAG: hypothetical protein ACYDGR_16590 [Candidatus Dormibacteria bacterium]
MADRHQYDARFREGFPSPTHLRWVGALIAAVVLIVAAYWFGRASVPISRATPQTRAVTVPGSGASRTENGVPVGYPQSESGAVAAATNYTQFLNGPLLLAPDKYRAAVGTVAAPEAKDKLIQDAERSLAAEQNNLQLVTNAARGIPVSIAAYPLAYHVNNYSSSVVEVALWVVSVVGENGQLAPSQAWDTITVDLEWTNGDWKETSAGSTPGPVPVLGQAPVQTKDLPAQLKDFRVFSYAPSS